MVEPSLRAKQLLGAFDVFCTGACTHRLAESVAYAVRETRRALFPEDAIMERLVERNAAMGTTTVHQLLELTIDMPEARGLRDEWIEYKRSLSAYPAVCAFFRGHDYDPLYADRCYARIKLGMLDDNMFWRATGSSPPGIPPTLQAIAEKIFQLDLTTFGGKKRKAQLAAAAPPLNDERDLVNVEQREHELKQLQQACMTGLRDAGDAYDQALQAFDKDETSQQQQLDTAVGVVQQTRADLADLAVRLTGLANKNGQARKAGYLNEVHTRCAHALDDILKAASATDHPTDSGNAYVAALVKPPVVAVVDSVIADWMQREFEYEGGVAMRKALLGAIAKLKSLKSSYPLVATNMQKLAQCIEDTIHPEPVKPVEPAVITAALTAHVNRDTVDAVSALWVGVRSRMRGAASFEPSMSVAGMKAAMLKQLTTLLEEAKKIPPSPSTDGVRLVTRMSDFRPDPSRLIAVDATTADAFLTAFVERIDVSILPGMKAFTAKTIARLVPPPPIVANVPLATHANWAVNMHIFGTLRTVMLQLAETVPAHLRDRMVDVLRLESAGRGEPVLFCIVWNAVAQLYAVL